MVTSAFDECARCEHVRSQHNGGAGRCYQCACAEFAERWSEEHVEMLEHSLAAAEDSVAEYARLLGERKILEKEMQERMDYMHRENEALKRQVGELDRRVMMGGGAQGPLQRVSRSDRLRGSGRPSTGGFDGHD